MIEGIVQELRKLSHEQIREVRRTLDAYLHAGENDNIMDFNLHYFARFLGIGWDDSGTAYMDLGCFNENVYRVAQGGAIYTLADIAAGVLIGKKAGKDKQVFTQEMKMNFIKKGTGDRLFAYVDILHLGKTTAVAQCQIKDENGAIVAHSVGTFYIKEG